MYDNTELLFVSIKCLKSQKTGLKNEHIVG